MLCWLDCRRRLTPVSTKRCWPKRRVPSSLLQDFWGEQNLILGRGADHILAIDDQAAERNAARYAVPTVGGGIPASRCLRGLDIGGIRVADARGHRVTAARTRHRVLWSGPPLSAGYRRTVEHFIASARDLRPGVRLRCGRIRARILTAAGDRAHVRTRLR